MHPASAQREALLAAGYVVGDVENLDRVRVRAFRHRRIVTNASNSRAPAATAGRSGNPAPASGAARAGARRGAAGGSLTRNVAVSISATGRLPSSTRSPPAA